jgi:hypothetical protein
VLILSQGFGGKEQHSLGFRFGIQPREDGEEIAEALPRCRSCGHQHVFAFYGEPDRFPLVAIESLDTETMDQFFQIRGGEEIIIVIPGSSGRLFVGMHDLTRVVWVGSDFLEELCCGHS